MLPSASLLAEASSSTFSGASPLSGVAVRKPHEARLNGFAMGAAPEQIAGVFAYLASDAAAYITGEVQVVDGGAGLG